jgi:phosphatidylglycerophosphatase A
VVRFGKPSKKAVYLFIISFFGTGLTSKKMPGTIGSLAATLIAMALPPSKQLFVIISIGLFLLGSYCCQKYIVTDRHEVDKDPGYIVIDEAFGIFFSCQVLYPEAVSYGIEAHAFLLINFLLFRLFDIKKPFFIKKVEKKLASKNNTVGMGIMVDDGLAAIYTSVCMWFALGIWTNGFAH